MIIRWYLIKEVIKTFLAVFVVVFLMLLSTQVLRVLSAVSNGSITLDLLFVFLALTNIKSMAIIFPFTFYLSIILALSRFYKDSEIIAMWSCGISPKTILTSLLPVILVFVLIETLFALHISPWAYAKITLLKKQVKSNADIDVLVSGQFNQFDNGERVIYVENITSNGVLKRVFLRLRKGVKKSVVYADTAHIKYDTATGARYIIFNQGYRYDGQPGSGDYRVTQFKEYGVMVENKQISTFEYDKDEQAFSSLLKQSNNAAIAELQWRISVVLSMVVLALLAIPLSKSSPRKGRYAKVLPAIMVYFLYSTLLGVSRNFVKKGEIDPLIGMWWVHILFVLLFLLLFSQQMGWIRFYKFNKKRLTSE